VTVLLFAVARQLAGHGRLELELPAGATAGDLRAALVRAAPPLAAWLSGMRLAVDSAYVADDFPIPPGAEVAVIPPTSGG
jgi:molybdopterin converting factor small subunit